MKMSFKITSLIILCSIIICSSFFYGCAVDQSLALEEQCIANNGNWVEGHSECEDLSEELCAEHGGEFNECASACRHNSGEGACIAMCVPLCVFS